MRLHPQLVDAASYSQVATGFSQRCVAETSYFGLFMKSLHIRVSSCRSNGEVLVKRPVTTPVTSTKQYRAVELNLQSQRGEAVSISAL